LIRQASIAAAIALALLLSPASWAVRPQTWTATTGDLKRGDADGIAVSDRGRLFLAPRLVRIGEWVPGEQAQVFAMTADAVGNLYLGTGPDGRVLKVSPSGKQTIFFDAEEPLVTALTFLPGGDLLAAAAPGGSIYRIRPDGSGESWSETDERYVWALSVGDGGAVYAGTGEHGKILKINRSGTAEIFFDSDEPHIVTLLPRADGGLWAGGAGRGLVYLIDRSGNALALYDDELEEVVALGAEPDGSLIAAFVAPPVPERRRPAVALRLPDGVQVGATNENVGSLEESSGPTVRGYIEGLPPVSEDAPQRSRGRLVRVGADGRIDELWQSSSEAPFCVWIDDAGRVLFGTGEPARLYRIEEGDDIALLSTLVEAQVTALTRVGRSTFVATSNPATTYRLDEAGAESGVFLVSPFDAGAPARWGTIRWRTDGGSAGAEFYTRTGNSADPDETWSAWSPALTDARGSAIVNPDGRYLQWRARFVGARGAGPRVSSVAVSYEPYNRPPQIREFRAYGGPAVSESLVFRWSSHDPDGDPVELAISYRLEHETSWTPVEAASASKPEKDDDGERWHSGRLKWDTTAVPEGQYEVRAVATDQSANAPADGRRVELEPIWLTVDRTPPEIDVAAAEDGGFEITLTDAHSEIRSLEVIRDDRTLYTARPADGVYDARRETFRLEPDDDAEGLRVRGSDLAGNKVEASLSGT
jgi:hypothetical protein